MMLFRGYIYMNIKPTNHIICLLFFVSLLSISVLEARANWAVLIYGHAGHNLTSAMRDDLLEMEQAGSSEDFNIVVQVDINTKDRGTKLWKIKYKIDPIQDLINQNTRNLIWDHIADKRRALEARVFGEFVEII